jgi:hypothetical protein
MPLFGFGDIQFNKGSVTRKGPLGSLVDSRFQQTTLRYPVDVGNYDKAHYMVFYIRQQSNTQFKGDLVDENALNSAAAAVQKNAFSQLNTSQSSQASNIGSKFGGELLNKLNDGLSEINKATGGALEGLTSAVGKAAGGVITDVNNLFGRKTALIGGNSAATQRNIDTSIKAITNKGPLGSLRKTQLTTDAIALYMPDTLQFNYTQSYDQLSLGGEGLGQAAAAGASVIDAFKSGEGAVAAIDKAASAGKETVKQLAFQKGAGAVGSLTGSGQSAQLGFTAAAGTVQNPMLEMIYKSPNFRSFQFDFMFYPRDEREALEVQKIIERFRFHQAPELSSAQGFLIPPSEFDIKFYYGGVQNPNIPSIATCVLASINVNYAPNGWTAFEVPGENAPAVGRTGMPISIQVTLEFQETTYLTKSDFKQDKDFSSQQTAEFTRASQSGEYGSS